MKPEPRRRAAATAVAVGTACLALLAFYTLTRSMGRTTHGFIAYYAAARALLDGQLGPWVYVDETFRAYAQALSQSTVFEIFGPNPPTMSLLAVPLARLDPQTARSIWLGVSLVLLALSVAALARDALAHRSPRVACAIALVLLSPAVFANLASGQAYLALLALFTVAALAHERQFVAGVALGAAFVLKSAAAPWLAMAPFLGRGRTAAAAAFVVAAAAALALAWVGPGIWIAYYNYVLAYLDRPAAAVTAYQTTAGFFRHMCVVTREATASTALGCGPLTAAGPMLLLGSAWVATLKRARGASAADWIPAAVCMSVLSMPIAEDHQFVLLAVPVFWILRTRAPLWGLALFAALYAVPAGLTVHRFTTGVGSLLAYPRLYAAWLLWALVVSSLGRAGTRDSEPSPAAGVAAARGT